MVSLSRSVINLDVTIQSRRVALNVATLNIGK